jgi:putative membrane protein
MLRHGKRISKAMTFTTASFVTRTTFRRNILLKIFVTAFAICWGMTFINTPNRANWFTENGLTLIFLVLLFTTYKKFRFSDLSYSLFFVYILLHIYGAEYTYAENPFGYWLKEQFHLQRNPYDRIVHFSFGLMLTYPMRDYFKNYFEWPDWVCWILPIEITLSFSAAYELIEWLVADFFFPSEGIAYLGTQGDIWDAQKDMGIAFCGAVTAMLLCSILKKSSITISSKNDREKAI